MDSVSGRGSRSNGGKLRRERERAEEDERKRRQMEAARKRRQLEEEQEKMTDQIARNFVEVLKEVDLRERR